MRTEGKSAIKNNTKENRSRIKRERRRVEGQRRTEGNIKRRQREERSSALGGVQL